MDSMRIVGIDAKKGDTVSAQVTLDGHVCPQISATSKLGERCSGLMEIEADLLLVNTLIAAAQSSTDAVVNYGLWMSAVVSYGRCFASADRRRTRLDVEHVIKVHPDAVPFHRRLVNLRNEYFAHAGECGEGLHLANIVLSPESLGQEVVSVNYLQVLRASASEDDTPRLRALCEGLLGVVKEMRQAAEGRLLQEYRKKPIEDLYRAIPKRT